MQIPDNWHFRHVSCIYFDNRSQWSLHVWMPSSCPHGGSPCCVQVAGEINCVMWCKGMSTSENVRGFFLFSHLKYSQCQSKADSAVSWMKSPLSQTYVALTYPALCLIVRFAVALLHVALILLFSVADSVLDGHNNNCTVTHFNIV